MTDSKPDFRYTLSSYICWGFIEDCLHSMRISETRPEKKRERERGGRESGVGEKEPSLTSLSNN